MRNRNATGDQLLEGPAPYAQEFARAETPDRPTDETLCQGETCFRLLAESLEGHASFVLDARGRVVCWNAGAERLLGFRADEVLGKSFTRFYPCEDVCRGRPEHELEAAAEGRFEGEGEYTRKDGTRFRAHAVLTALRDEVGCLDGFLLLLKETPAPSACEAEAVLRALGLLAEGAFLLDVSRAGNLVVWANPAFARIAGRAADEIVGRPLELAPGPAGGRAVPADVDAALRERRPWTGELTATRADGGPAWRQLSLTPVPGPAGRVTHFLGVLTDVTERKYMEDWFRQGQKMTAVGWLAGGIVHDFNNLLTALLGYCDILLKEPLPEGLVRDSVQQILRGGEWGAALTRQLLAFVRNQTAEPRVVDLRGVLAETKSMLRRLIGENLELEMVLDPALGRVRADPAKIEQVLINLAVNARDAMPEGGRITLEASNAVVEAGGGPGGLPPGAYVVLAVADTGCGMTEEVLAAVSQRRMFSTKDRGKGTGLGLYTVQEIVRQSNGVLTVTSELGRGTRFTVYLPRVEGAAPAELPARAPAGPPRRGCETVLVVEDEPGVRAMVCRTLRQEGYTILEAGDGAEAVAVCERHAGPIQLLVTDVVMPKMSAPELVRRLGSVYPDLKVLYLSGYPLQAGESFLAKPFTLESLTTRVRELLDGAQG